MHFYRPKCSFEQKWTFYHRQNREPTSYDAMHLLLYHTFLAYIWVLRLSLPSYNIGREIAPPLAHMSTTTPPPSFLSKIIPIIWFRSKRTFSNWYNFLLNNSCYYDIKIINTYFSKLYFIYALVGLVLFFGMPPLNHDQNKCLLVLLKLQYNEILSYKQNKTIVSNIHAHITFIYNKQIPGWFVCTIFIIYSFWRNPSITRKQKSYIPPTTG